MNTSPFLIIIIIFFVGIAATTAMTLFIFSFKNIGLIRIDTFSAIGSLFSESMDKARLTGWIAHGISGMVFCLLYAVCFVRLDIFNLGFLVTLTTGALIGFIHGLVVSFLILNFVGEHHPLARFRHESIEMALVYLGGHTVYGIFISLLMFPLHKVGLI